MRIKAEDDVKIPASKSRIRFALDNNTWLRLLGKSKVIPTELQAHLSEAHATEVN
jgi:hypothetical protein